MDHFLQWAKLLNVKHARKKFRFFLFFPENGFLHFMQIVYNWHEM